MTEIKKSVDNVNQNDDITYMDAPTNLGEDDEPNMFANRDKYMKNPSSTRAIQDAELLKYRETLSFSGVNVLPQTTFRIEK